jgi:hypothetical protein
LCLGSIIVVYGLLGHKGQDLVFVIILFCFKTQGCSKVIKSFDFAQYENAKEMQGKEQPIRLFALHSVYGGE